MNEEERAKLLIDAGREVDRIVTTATRATLTATIGPIKPIPASRIEHDADTARTYNPKG